MPTFSTPKPIHATLDMNGGSVRVSASDRADTVVEVRPSHEANNMDVQAATQTRVEYGDSRLLVKVPSSKVRSLFGMGPSVEVHIDLPEGSSLDARGWGEFDCAGRLGNVQIKTASGDIRVGHAAVLRARTADGDITVTQVDGHTDVSTMSGDIRIGDVHGSARLKTASGDLTVDEVTGDLQMNTASGDISVARATASVNARTASGNVRIGEVAGGAIVLQTGDGQVEVGVRNGTAAWLDVQSMDGTVRSAMEATGGPAANDQTVSIRARTMSGDIVVRRA